MEDIQLHSGKYDPEKHKKAAEKQMITHPFFSGSFITVCYFLS